LLCSIPYFNLFRCTHALSFLLPPFLIFSFPPSFLNPYPTLPSSYFSTTLPSILIIMSDEEPFVPNYRTCKELSDICPIEATVYGTKLDYGSNIFFAVAFLACFIAQLYFGIRAKTWSYMVWLGIGTAFEIIGYIGRFMLARNPWSMNAFIISYITLLLAPTLVAAAISVTFKSIVIWYGKQWSVLRPRLYPLVFVGTDFFSIFVQVIGGGATATATIGNGGETVKKIGEALVLGGVAFQVVNMLVCGTLMLIYTKRRKEAMANGVQVFASNPGQGYTDASGYKPMSRAMASEKEAKRTRWFVYALAIAYCCIIVRCSYRIAETVPEISIEVMRKQGLFLALDGAMLLISISLISALHPYNFFPYFGVNSKIRRDWDQNEDVALTNTEEVRQ
jgi:hypothetical protein